MFFSFNILLEFLSQMIIGVGYISHNNLFPEPLEPDDEKIYLEKLKNGDESAKKILIEHNLRLVAHVAKKYQSTNIDQDDLISIGTIGLIKGINSFKSDKNYKLATYVARCIENEILMYLRANKKYVLDVYLNEPIGKDKDDNVVTLQEVLEEKQKDIEDEIDLKFQIENLYKKMEKVLSKREKTIIRLRYGLDDSHPRTLEEVGKEFNVTRERIRQIEAKALRKLRHPSRSKRLKDYMS